MRIVPVVEYKNFTSKNVLNSCGDDDVISQARRAFIREHYVNEIMPYSDILDNSKRLEEYELKKMVASLCGQKVSSDSLSSIYETLKFKKSELPSNLPKAPSCRLNFEAIEELPIFNLELSSAKLGVYRGQTLQANPNYLKLVKQAGIERIVDLAGYEALEENCKELGLEYLYYATPPYYFLQGSMFKTEQDCRKTALRQGRLFQYSEGETKMVVERSVNVWKKHLEEELDDFVKFILTMQKGNLYIGCEYGTYTTDNAMMLNSYFNPLYVREKKYVNFHNRIFLNQFVNLYKNLRIEHKELMGWTKQFDTMLHKKLLALV